ncbi:anaerobic sulfatase maturase [Photobacterium gaetbulicola]|uniref:Arylsulfatase regulator (Fe-S oxidoreductase) n=1 Tax=Photobacterium gaetbulicola Gung47 TaxID=658445 RepID=A0A0C5WJS1_9GAMM|nr:anaerobic sulfatase maturase [Photobacterium gaetbulicola]AJR06467.1 arylsulfatase regulator (Fe-S oxidoreductase) [Photobacterium gaetbulicola Gung47]PSU02495.1 anaerobic sulfatase maturase [Photobacterium gaetbulicola]
MTIALPYSLAIKPVGSSCNLDCSYCYYLQHQPGGEKKMDRATAEALIKNHIQSQPGKSKQVDFIWHGGEPLLIGRDFYKDIITLQDKWGEGKCIVNTIQTNGTLINKRWAAFFKQHNIMVGVSIDGPNLLNDIARIDCHGKSSFERTMRGIRLLRDYNVEFNTLTVVNNRTYHSGKQIYDFLKHNGSLYMQFQPCIDHELDRRFDYDWSLSGEQWGTFLCDVFDAWCQRDVGKIYVQFFENCLMILLGRPSQMCHHAQTCGQQLMAEAQGQVYSCDHFGYDSYQIGNARHQSLADMVVSPAQVQFGQSKHNSLCRECKSCDFLPLCNGGCPKNRTLATADTLPLNQLCQGYKMFFNYALPRLLKMVDVMKAGYPAQYYSLF